MINKLDEIRPKVPDDKTDESSAYRFKLKNSDSSNISYLRLFKIHKKSYSGTLSDGEN